MTDDDRAQALAIEGAADTADPVTIAHLIHAYYGDRERADRAPRALLYLHLGMLAGLVYRQAAKH